MNAVRAAITGKYETLGDVTEADCVIAQSFGANRNGPGYVNELLADFVVQSTPPALPRLLQGEIADALPANEREPELVIRGRPSTGTGGELDSWRVLEKAREYMRAHDLKRPLLVGQAHHIGRVALHAEKRGIYPVIPSGLPTDFDPESTQIWTRRRSLWVMREVGGMAVLKIQGKL